MSRMESRTSATFSWFSGVVSGLESAVAMTMVKVGAVCGSSPESLAKRSVSSVCARSDGMPGMVNELDAGAENAAASPPTTARRPIQEARTMYQRRYEARPMR